jgi:hypothetical protein
MEPLPRLNVTLLFPPCFGSTTALYALIVFEIKYHRLIWVKEPAAHERKITTDTARKIPRSDRAGAAHDNKKHSGFEEHDYRSTRCQQRLLWW